MNLIPLQTDFVGPWNTLWGALTGAVPNLALLLGIAGVALLVYALITHVNAKRSGQGGDNKKLAWAVVLGGALVAPGFIIPIILKIFGLAFDLVAGTVGRLF